MVSDIRRPNLNPQSPRMTFEDALNEALNQANAPALPEATCKHIGKLAAASPLYAAQLLANPGWAQLLQAHEEDPAPLTRRRHALLWNGTDPGVDAPREAWLRALQRGIMAGAVRHGVGPDFVAAFPRARAVLERNR